jgi:hypothetical protein
MAPVRAAGFGLAVANGDITVPRKSSDIGILTTCMMIPSMNTPAKRIQNPP